MPPALPGFSGGHPQAVELARNFHAGEQLVAPQGHDRSADLFFLGVGFELAREHFESEWGIEGTVIIDPSRVAAATPHLDARAAEDVQNGLLWQF